MLMRKWKIYYLKSQKGRCINHSDTGLERKPVIAKAHLLHVKN